MRRRFVGVLLSIGLAAFGTAVLVGYVQSAHDKAAAEEPVETVFVVTKLVPRGTKAVELEGKVKLTEVAADQVVDGAVADLDDIKGKVAAADLLPGEQLLDARFQTAQELGRAGVPKGLLEVTVQLTPDRALGGNIRPGDTVAVLSSFEPFEVDAAGAPPGANVPKKLPNTTQVILHKVLVTNVQTTKEVKPDTTDDDEEDRPKQAQGGSLLVTLALDATAVQRVVFTAEFGTLWLSAEPSDAPDAPTRIETRGTVY